MQQKYTHDKIAGWNSLPAIYKVLICLALAISFYFFIPVKQLSGYTHLLSAWDIFSLFMLTLSWLTFFTTTPHQIRGLAKSQDESRTLIFIIVVVSTITSLLAILILLTSKDLGKLNSDLPLFVAIIGMASSWFLVHTTFTLRYAHLYYGDNVTETSVHAGGLDFPNEVNPDYIDFAYFSFILGMTFQVSDVQITCKSIRRLALVHGILAFGFNTIIVALTINLIAGLRK